MSVDYEAILAVGKVFDNEEQATKYFLDHGKLTEDDLNVIRHDGLGEFLYDSETLPCGEYLNCVTGGEFYVGYVIDIEDFDKSLFLSRNSWQELFNEEPDIILEVRVS